MACTCNSKQLVPEACSVFLATQSCQAHRVTLPRPGLVPPRGGLGVGWHKQTLGAHHQVQGSGLRTSAPGKALPSPEATQARAGGRDGLLSPTHSRGPAEPRVAQGRAAGLPRELGRPGLLAHLTRLPATRAPSRHHLPGLGTQRQVPPELRASAGTGGGTGTLQVHVP